MILIILGGANAGKILNICASALVMAFSIGVVGYETRVSPRCGLLGRI